MDQDSSTHYNPSSRPVFGILESPPPHNRQPSINHGSPSDSRKRRRLSNAAVSSSVSQPVNEAEENIDSIDLTEADGNPALSRVLAKQREDAITAQMSNEDESGRSRLTSYKCPVCMETPVDATSTACGHLFCHKCIIDTLRFSEEQRADHSGKTPRGTCPVCRKPLSRMDAPGPKRNLIPLQIKLTTKKRNEVAGRVDNA
ncbi:hypothetical protein P175DRAFT_0498651 [Aspergillus ochraceoroseus IBT 24754]|uniref:RING-type domain-containing protein n=2 Tax=Aspergillus ochraceoroseus TaxID=138278 RepID=A0A2T5MAJ5_9EURO|nr:uncharacterized protein P175DRAFT_0498651 [Aspergillus ochraceoroseus IBT 24754]PTU25547.1 hypothetical protein P175DRAFT_0498651 [Aspergillus ochraceoroseus IBT 24754]